MSEIDKKTKAEVIETSSRIDLKKASGQAREWLLLGRRVEIAARIEAAKRFLPQ